MKVSKDRKFHGSPYDRGNEDSYYRRPSDPHWWPEGTYFGRRVGRDDMTATEIEEYYAGYKDNEDDGDYKDYG